MTDNNSNKKSNNLKKPELMAPAGDMTMLITAVNAGADAVYFGVGKLNMRAKAKNFSLDELKNISEYCRSKNVKTYLTLNTIIYEDELDEIENIIRRAKENKIDRIICWDLGAIELCNKYEMPFAVSTQASVSNSISLETYKRLGAERIVLARECSLEEIKNIRAKTDLEIEAFVHGAMCIAVSGRCFMSHHLFNKSANRGECVQPCRREFKVIDDTTDKELIIGDDYILSPKDLCTIEFIDKLIEAGIDSFKIEGRKRSPEYVYKVVSIYRKAIDLYFESGLTPKIKQNFLKELEEVYNRGFSSGFYFDMPSSNDYSDIHGSKAATRKEFVGRVVNYFKQPQIAHVALETGKITSGDKVYIIGPTTGVVELILSEMMLDDNFIQEAVKGDSITFKCEQLIRPRDSVYLVKRVLPVVPSDV